MTQRINPDGGSFGRKDAEKITETFRVPVLV